MDKGKPLVLEDMTGGLTFDVDANTFGELVFIEGLIEVWAVGIVDIYDIFLRHPEILDINESPLRLLTNEFLCRVYEMSERIKCIKGYQIRPLKRFCSQCK